MSMPPPPLPMTPKRSSAQRAASVRPEGHFSPPPINVDTFSPRRASVPPQPVATPPSLGDVLLNTPRRIKSEVVEQALRPSTPSPSRPRVTPSPSPSPSRRRRRSPSVPQTSTLDRAISRSRLSPSPRRFKSPSLLPRRSVSRSLSVSPRSLRAGTAPVSPFSSSGRSRTLRTSATPSPRQLRASSRLPDPTSSSPSLLPRGSVAPVLPPAAPVETLPPLREPTPAHLVDRNRGRLPSNTPGPVILDSSSSSSSSGSDSEMEILPAPVTFAASRSRSLSLVPPSTAGTSTSMREQLAEEDNHQCTIEVHVVVKGPNGDAIARGSYQRQAHLGPQRCFNSRQNEVLDREAPKTARRLEHELRKVRRQG